MYNMGMMTMVVLAMTCAVHALRESSTQGKLGLMAALEELDPVTEEQAQQELDEMLKDGKCPPDGLDYFDLVVQKANELGFNTASLSFGNKTSTLGQLRACIFSHKSKVIQALNSRPGTKAKFGHNMFSFLLKVEKSKRKGLVKPSSPTNSTNLLEVGSGRGFVGNNQQSILSPDANTPSSFTWLGTAIAKAPLNQGQCGSCWAFSASETIAAMKWIISNATGSSAPVVDLSPQQLVSCSTSNDGCNGGMYTTVWETYTPSAGLLSLSEYPYVNGASGASSPSCNNALLSQYPNEGVTASANTYVGSQTCNFIQGATNNQLVAQLERNPFSIALYASADCFENYQGGVLSAADCSCTVGQEYDHAIIMIGYSNYSPSDPNSVVFTVKNQWGTNWGDDGYGYFSGDGADGTCLGLLNMNSCPAYPSVVQGSSDGTNPPSAASLSTSSLLFALVPLFVTARL